MKQDHSLRVLNLLLAIEYRSMPMYLVDAKLWTHPGDEKASHALEHIVIDQKAMVARLTDVIIARGGKLDTGGYPMDFTDTHDLSLDYLITRLIEYQQRDIAVIARLIDELPRADTEARTLAQEMLGSERAHLEMLQELAPQAA